MWVTKMHHGDAFSPLPHHPFLLQFQNLEGEEESSKTEI